MSQTDDVELVFSCISNQKARVTSFGNMISSRVMVPG